MHVRTLKRCLLSALVSLACAPAAFAAPFVYQGTLMDGGKPANGRYDLQVQLYRSQAGLDAISAPVTFDSVQVTNGTFRIDTDVATDGASDKAYVAVSVRDGKSGAQFSALPGRESVALTATTVGTCWSTSGDAGSVAGVNFLGTSDNAPFEIRANNFSAVRYEPTVTSGTRVNIIAGAPNNLVGDGAYSATIAGGGALNSNPSYPNRVFDNGGTIGGGTNNTVGVQDGNPALDSFATIAGGFANAAKSSAAIGGGLSNSAFGSYSVIGGGNLNLAYGYFSTVGGGYLNNITQGGLSATIAGGESNEASGSYAAIAGGKGNLAGGDYSFAGGRRAIVRDYLMVNDLSGDNGTFIWADSTDADFASTGRNQFLVRAAGGVGINTNVIPAQSDLVVKGRNGTNTDLYLQSGAGNIGYNFGVDGTDAATSDMFIARFNGTTFTDLAKFNAGTGTFQVFVNTPISPAGGSWAAASDARLKHDIEPLGGALDKLLALKGVTFEYNNDIPEGYGLPGRRTGFVAQQVETVFPDWISYDAQGFRLVAPKGFEALTVEALRELQTRSESEIAATRASAQRAEAEAAHASAQVSAYAERVAVLESERAEQNARLDRVAAQLDVLAHDNATLRDLVQQLTTSDTARSVAGSR